MYFFKCASQTDKISPLAGKSLYVFLNVLFQQNILYNEYFYISSFNFLFLRNVTYHFGTSHICISAQPPLITSNIFYLGNRLFRIAQILQQLQRVYITSTLIFFHFYIFSYLFYWQIEFLSPFGSKSLTVKLRVLKVLTDFFYIRYLSVQNLTKIPCLHFVTCFACKSICNSESIKYSFYFQKGMNIPFTPLHLFFIIQFLYFLNEISLSRSGHSKCQYL